MGLSPLKDLLSKAVSHAGIQRQVTASQICASCDEVLAHFEGTGIRARAASYRNGILKIVTDNGSIAHRLSLQQEVLIQEITKQHPRLHLKKLTFQIIPTHEF